jgi:hypothetical protein
MFRWLFVTILLSAGAVAAVWMLVPYVHSTTSPTTSTLEDDAREKKKPAPVPREEAPLPQRSSTASTGSRGQPEVYVYRKENAHVFTEPVIIPDCPLAIVEKQEVASEKEGVLLFIGTELQMGEIVPPDKQLPEAKLGFLAILVGDKPVGEDCFKLPGDDKNNYRRARESDTLSRRRYFSYRKDGKYAKFRWVIGSSAANC